MFFAGFATPRLPPPDASILFVGSFAHQPNRHGILWFIERILPLSRAADAHRMVEAHEGQGKIVLDPTLH